MNTNIIMELDLKLNVKPLLLIKDKNSKLIIRKDLSRQNKFSKSIQKRRNAKHYATRKKHFKKISPVKEDLMEIENNNNL